MFDRCDWFYEFGSCARMVSIVQLEAGSWKLEAGSYFAPFLCDSKGFPVIGSVGTFPPVASHPF